jgi:hypothetical protein
MDVTQSSAQCAGNKVLVRAALSVATKEEACYRANGSKPPF